MQVEIKEKLDVFWFTGIYIYQNKARDSLAADKLQTFINSENSVSNTHHEIRVLTGAVAFAQTTVNSCLHLQWFIIAFSMGQSHFYMYYVKYFKLKNYAFFFFLKKVHQNMFSLFQWVENTNSL